MVFRAEGSKEPKAIVKWLMLGLHFALYKCIKFSTGKTSAKNQQSRSCKIFTFTRYGVCAMRYYITMLELLSELCEPQKAAVC